MQSSHKFNLVRFSIGGMRRSTHNFSDQNCLVNSRTVYRGYICENGYIGDVAVKDFHMESEFTFQKEINVLSSLNHDNIISLVGYCVEEGEKMLVYEFMPNGSLFDCLHKDKNQSHSLTVERRLEICIGVAKALTYLHDHTLIHGYTRTDNILLDANFVAKISDFRFSRTVAGGPSSAPQITSYLQGGLEDKLLSRESDVYAFGVVLLEVLCEIRAWKELVIMSALPYIMKGELPAFISEHVKTNITLNCSKACASLLMECLDKNPDMRPSMEQVVFKLLTALELQELGEESAANDSSVLGERYNGPVSVKRIKKNSEHGRLICRSSKWSCESFSLKDIEIATGDFAVKNLLREGAFWKSYSGYISGVRYNGPVSVKRINKNSEHGNSAFQNEVQLLAGCDHVNITSLVGYCDDEIEKIIVYKSMHYGPLHDCLYDGYHRRLTVEQRLDICIGVAEGLSFLHEKKIIHCNLSSKNILLDYAWVPSISGIDLALSESPPQLIMDYKQGTEGYVAPECYEPNYQPGPKADVYAFAMLLLELLCEKPPWKSMVMLALEFAMKGVLPRFKHEGSYINITSECSQACGNLLRECLDIDPSKRPSMHQVLDELRLASRLQDYYWNGKDNRLQSFLLSDIKKATNNFSNCLGEGAFGKVYSGNISGNMYNGVVAVKRMSMDPEQGIPAFRKEIELVSACNHVNIISLLGFCEEGNEKILIYELMPNGSLYDYLYTDKDRIAKLTVEQRLDICIGVAKGIYYLHSRTDSVIIHSDLKTDNILLDQNLVPKIADFGLSRTRDAGPSTSKLTTNNIKGTEGYLAPECYEPKYQLSRKADVYSFGVVLLEVLCERPSWHRLVLLALPFIRRGELPNFTPDYVARHISSRCSRTCERLIRDCLDTDPVKRPDMNQVVTRLEEALRLQKKYQNDH